MPSSIMYVCTYHDDRCHPRGRFVSCRDKPITGYSVYNVTPDKAAIYFNKIQCFCFEEQRLRANEEAGL